MYFGTTDKRKKVSLDLSRANRHGLIAGATGTGKTVTLQTLAERFADNGVAVFAADIKGDLSGIASANDVVFWDVYGDQGHQIRATIESVGPVLLSKMLHLTQVQEGVLTVAFEVAKDIGATLTTIQMLKYVLEHMGQNAAAISRKHGNVTAGSIGAIQRQLTVLVRQGGSKFFGHPPLGLNDIISMPGRINVLSADKLIHYPRMYAAFMIWMLEELYRTLPEVGDADKPKLVVFVDEAHLLFDGSDHLQETVERVIRLIRSKGVGVYFVTQSPMDIPEPILAQLGNRFQHALRAFTPRDTRALRAAASTFRPNPAFDTATALQSLPIGQALVSTLSKAGEPSVVARVKIDLPLSRLGPATEAERVAAFAKLYPVVVEDVAFSPSSLNYANTGASPMLSFLGFLLACAVCAPVLGVVIAVIVFLAKR